MCLFIRSIVGLTALIGGMARFLHKAGHRSTATLPAGPEGEACPVDETARDGSVTSAFGRDNSIAQMAEYIEEPPGGHPEASPPNFLFPDEEAPYDTDDLVVSAFSRYAGIALFLLTLALAAYIIFQNF